MKTLLVPSSILKQGSTLTIRRWLKAVGQMVTKGEILLEGETETGLVEIESPDSGVVARVVAGAGTSIASGAVLAELGEQAMPTNQQMSSSASVQPVVRKNGGAGGGKVIPILMPQAGQSMEEGTIVKWRVEPGATITKGQIIFEVETDKAVVEVEAQDEGRLARIVVDAGQTIAVKKPVAYLAENDADVDALLGAPPAAEIPLEGQAAPTIESLAPAVARSASTAEATSTRTKASPAARKIAAARGVDLADIQGSGPGGRVMSFDVERAPEGTRKPVAAEDARATRKKLSRMRQAIAANLQASKQNIPHFYVCLSVDAVPMTGFYQERKKSFQCSLNDVITAACARVLKEFPEFRSRIEGNELVETAKANIGIAVSLEQGLTVPVLEGADQMSFEEIARNTRRIVENARAGRLEGIGRGVFTITNLGMFGVEEFSAIINPPESAILAVGAAQDAPVVKEGKLQVGRVLKMTLSCDHRVVDGALAAKFLARLKQVLENPTALD